MRKMCEGMSERNRGINASEFDGRGRWTRLHSAVFAFLRLEESMTHSINQMASAVRALAYCATQFGRTSGSP